LENVQVLGEGTPDRELQSHRSPAGRASDFIRWRDILAHGARMDATAGSGYDGYQLRSV
jgi:hypothetical protein